MVGPNYYPLKPIVSQTFKETYENAAPPKGWDKSAPQMADFPKGDWWRIFSDPVLDGLEGKVRTSNQSLKEYEAQYRKAKAMIDTARANLFPTLNGKFSFNRNAQGGKSVTTSTGERASTTYTNNTWQLTPTASWTIDIWGTIRRQIQEQVEATQASAALVANMRLSYELELATDYYSMRYQDSLIDLFSRNVKLYRDNLTIVENQLAAGVADPTAVYQARYLLQSTEASLANAHITRAQYEHAIAVLAGMPPASLIITPKNLPQILPAPPTALPAELLERRPDIAQAERNMASANAEIGYQIGAFFPQIVLTANYGYSGDPLPDLIQTATRFWGLGAGATETIFAGGARSAAIREAEADYDNAVATYRQTVLAAFQNTEDQLAALHWLKLQRELQEKAVASATQAVKVALNEYLAGTQIYTTVITAQQTQLQYEQNLLQILEQQFLAEIRLITDLGGGWSVRDLPSKSSLQSNDPFTPAILRPNK